MKPNQKQIMKIQFHSPKIDSRIGATASQEDIENISSGMSDESYSVTSGFASILPKSEIEKITSIFPSYTNPRIVAAQVLRTFAGVSDDVSGTLGKLKDLVRLGRQAGNQAQVDAARRALKVLE